MTWGPVHTCARCGEQVQFGPGRRGYPTLYDAGTDRRHACAALPAEDIHPPYVCWCGQWVVEASGLVYDWQRPWGKGEVHDCRRSTAAHAPSFAFRTESRDSVRNAKEQTRPTPTSDTQRRPVLPRLSNGAIAL